MFRPLFSDRVVVFAFLIGLALLLRAEWFVYVGAALFFLAAAPGGLGRFRHKFTNERTGTKQDRPKQR